MKVCVVTGTRAEFGIWGSVLRGIRESKGLELQLLVTGMHLLKRFGETVRGIEEGEYRIDARVGMYKEGESAEKSLARGVEGMGRAFRSLKSDLVMVLGDRLEMLAAASAALACQLPMGHVHGGEVAPGQWDEQIRHAITKMAQVHFCATKRAGDRIVRMGEPRGSVHVVGAPALDVAAFFYRGFSTAQGKKMLKLVQMGGPGPLVLLHPSGPDAEVEYRRTMMLIGVLEKAFPEKRIQVIGPNNDPGHEGILRAYGELGERILYDVSMPQAGFWATMVGCGLLVGNSSSGILEAATFGVPVVNIGERQAGRERNGNVIDVGWEAGAIRRAVERAVGDGAFLRKVRERKNLYGDGRAAERIVRVLEGVARKGGLNVVKRFEDR